MLFFPSGRCALLLSLGLLTSPLAHAQRAAAGPPTQDPFGHPAAREVPPGRYLSHSYKDGVLTINATDGSTRQVQPWATGVIKISYFAPGRAPVADSSVSVVQVPADLSTATFARKFDASPSVLALPGEPFLLLLTGAILDGSAPVVLVDKRTLRIKLLIHANDTLFSEATPAYRRQPTAIAPADDETPPSRINELAGTGVRFRLAPGERLYGTGSRALPLDRRGYRLELYNQAHYGYQNGEQNLNVTLPVVLSSRGYLLLFDHYAAGYLDLGKQRPDALEYGVEGLNSLSYFVITGDSQAQILERYTALTGRQPLPPRWALGLIQSRFGYRSQAELLDVAARMRAADFPLDALVLDLYWFGGTTHQGDFRWDATHFPDAAGMMRDLQAQGVHTVLISEPYVMRTSLNDSLVRTQGLVGTTAAGRPFTVGSFWAGPASILDVFKFQTRNWLGAQYRRLHEQGAAGWWSDLGEPENHPLAMHHALGPTRQVHNAYGITWAKILQENYAKEYPDERLFNLARSGWAGMQRNAVFPWSGDVSRTWSGLQAQVPIMLGMGQAGVGYMHSDAGGFGANATRDPELYTRWLQLAALGPILRPHSDQVVPPEPYTYPEPYRSIVRHYTHLRAELLPYLYTLAAENTLTGAPLVRAMDYTSGSDELHQRQKELRYWFHNDDIIPRHPEWSAAEYSLPPVPASLVNSQYLLGPSLLVAPINERGQRRRNVALPNTPGGWVDWATGRTLPGGTLVGLAAPLSHLPLLVRAGAIIPTTAYKPNTAAYRPDTLRVRYFPDPTVQNSTFTLYEDDGHSAQALVRREYATIELHAMADKDAALFDVRVNGTYPGAPLTRWLQLRMARVSSAPTGVMLSGTGDKREQAQWRYDATAQELLISFPVRQHATLGIDPLRLSTALAFPGMDNSLDPDPQTLQMPASRTFSQQAELRYETYLPASAPLRIRNARGQAVRELPTDAALGPHTLTWDGRDAQGRPAPLGYYDVELGGQHQQVVKVVD